MNRRGVIRLGALAALSVSAIGAGALQIVRGTQTRALARTCRDALAASFSDAIIDTPAGQAFLDRYVAFSAANPQAYPPENIYRHFLTSTNVIVHVEQGDELVFDDIFYAHRTPCANQLGAIYAPDGEHEA
jgi:putative copper export protein